MNQTTLEPYATLGVPRGASEREVREAYRRLAKRYHPDLDPTHETGDRMRRINQAWEILSSPTLRARYDAPRGRDSRVKGSRSLRSAAASAASSKQPNSSPATSNRAMRGWTGKCASFCPSCVNSGGAP